MIWLVLFPLGGVLNRWRGGWNPWPFGVDRPGHQIRRLTFAAASAAYAAACFDWTSPYVWLPAWWFYPVFAIAWWATLLLGWAQWQDMGTVDGSESGDFFGMVLRGYAWSGALALVLAGFGWAAVVFGLSGFGMAAVYWIGHKLPANFPLRATEFGESMTGAWFWLALWVSSRFA